MKIPLKLLSLVLLLIGLAIYSFQSAEDESGDLLGVWIYTSYDNGVVELTRSSSLKHDEPGIEFKKDGKLKKRQNVGWCGTPPISYGNYGGTWKMTSDSTLTIYYNYWGGKSEEDWQVLRLEKNRLRVKVIATRDEEFPNSEE